MRMAVVLGLTLALLVLSAILLPPRGSSAKQRSRDREAPVILPH